MFVWARCSRIWDGWGLFGLDVLVSGMVGVCLG